ncbi:MAG TPA: GAF domain-containing protein, partial [Anaerolineae bacterium]|nr:GAF domain-containing protein [Anaerolineae bacterium]
MNATIRNISSILAFFLLTAGLGRLTYVLGMNVAPGLWLAYLGLLIFMTISGVYLAGGKVSLLPMMSVAGFLTMGLVPIMWAAYIAALVYGVIRYRFAERWGESFSSWQSVVTLTAINVVVQAGGIFVGGRVYLILGGEVPVTSFTWRSWEPFIALVLSSMSFNVLVIGTYIVSLKRETVASFLKQIPDLLRYEGIPMVLAPLTALIYTQLGWWQWVLFAAVLVGVSLVTQNLNQTSLRLERRLRELKSLQAVGQALSSTLDVDQVLRVIHQQVDKLITAHTFYVALYDERADEVSFPLAYEGGERVFWQSRQAGDGLTEYVLRTKQPLLIRDNVEETLRELGVLVMAHGKPAACWLGVPMMAGDEILG